MGVFTQNKGETIIINGEISVTVLDVNGDDVVLGIDAPVWMEIAEIETYLGAGESDDHRPLRPR